MNAAAASFPGVSDSPNTTTPHTIPQTTVAALLAKAVVNGNRLRTCCHPTA